MNEVQAQEQTEMTASHDAFQEGFHSKHFDARFRLNLRGLKKEYESFNEFQLLKKCIVSVKGKNFLDLGCATGELYRYLNAYYSELKYHGVDISQPSISRAKVKYPEGQFCLIGEERSVTEEIQRLNIDCDILFSRDVVVHQARPFEFLQEIIQIPKEALIIRTRTRDKGATVLDPDASAQFYCGNWVPYMILNVDEIVECVRSCTNIEELQIVKNPMVLGGYHGRYVDKDCFYPETGTAETAIYLKKSPTAVKNPVINITENKETAIYSGVFSKKPQFLFKALLNRLVR